MKNTTWLLAAACALAASAETLTWNGGDGGAWDATTANWTTAGGAATAWVDGSDIVVPAGQTVNATDVFRVSGATLGAGAGIGGSGALLLDGPIDVASGAANLSVPAWTGGACAKTGAGDLAANQLAGLMTVSGGRLLTGGFHGARAAAVEAGGTHVRLASDAAAANLVANGSFEESATAMAASGYMYVKGGQMPTSWDNPSSDLFVRINATGGSPWNGSAKILDGTYMVGFQRSGTASQTVSVPSDGFYELTYLTCKRSSSSHQRDHFLEVTVDGVRRFSQLSLWLLANPVRMSTGPIWLAAGTHVVGFRGEERWLDATTFVDDVQLRACAPASASALPNETVLADGAAAAPALAPANYISYLTKTGDGVCTVADPVTIPGSNCVISANGRLAFTGKVTGATMPNLIARGPGVVAFTGGLQTLAPVLEAGTLEIAGASNFGLQICTRAGVPATFVMDTAVDAANAEMSVLGTGPATIRTTGGAHTFSVGTGNSKAVALSVPQLTFDVGAGDLVQLPYLYQVYMNNVAYATDVVKDGPGRLHLQAGTPVNVNGWGLAGQVVLRNGTLELGVDDLKEHTVHPLTGATHLYSPLLGSLEKPLQVGDAGTPADAALVVKPRKADFASTRAVNVGAQGASAVFDASALDGSALFGDVMLGRAETLAKGPATDALMFGALTRAAGCAETATVVATGSVLVDGCSDAGVAIASSGTLGFARTAVTPVSLGALDLSGAYALSFVNGASPVVHAGALRLGATRVALVDRLSGGVASVVGTRALFTYDTLEGDPAQLLTMDPDSCMAGYTYAFSHDAAAKTVSLTVRAAADSPNYTWMSPGDASWSAGSSWDRGAAPDGADVFAVFGSVPTAPTTVTLDGAVTLGGLTFANMQGYTLAGGSLALAPQDGARPVIRVDYGTHVVASDVGTTDGGAIVVEAAAGAKVVFDGAVNAPLDVRSGAVGFGAHARVNASMTVVPDAETAVDGDVTVSGATTLAGTLTGSGRLTKTGAGDLSLPASPGATRPFSGTLAVERGALNLGAPALDKATVELGAEAQMTVDPGTHGLTGTFRRAGASWTAGMQPFCAWALSLGTFETNFKNLELITEEFFGTDKSDVFHVLDADKPAPTLPEACRQGGTNPDYWVASWEGFLTVPASGVYEFSCKPDDAMLLAIDRRSVMQSTNCMAVACSVYLEKGPHAVYIGLVEISGNAGLPLNVKRPGSSTVEGLPVAWLSPTVAAKRTVGTGALAPADGTVLSVRQGAGVNTAFTGPLAGAGTGVVALQTQTDGSSGLFEFSDWMGGIPYLRQGELALVAPGRTLDAVGSDYSSGTFSLIGAAGVKSLSGHSTTSLGAHLWAHAITSDDTCGISPDKTYTHLVSFPLSGDTNPRPVVNGVAFDGRGAFDGAGPDTALKGTTGFTGFKSLFNSFTYGSKDYSFTLKGLEPGRVYDYRFYWMTYGVGGSGDGTRTGTFTFSGQDADRNPCTWQTYSTDLEKTFGSTPNGSFAILGCRYVAGPDGTMTVRVQSRNGHDTVHCYAFSNELLSPGTSAGDRMTIAPDAGTRATLRAQLNGTADVTVGGAGEQRLAGLVKMTKPLKVEGHLTLETGADVQSGVALAGGTLEMRGGSKLSGLSGTGTLDFRWGDPRPYGDLCADGNYNDPPAFRVVNFTGDDDSGITPSKNYLLALNYRSAASQTTFNYVNEVPFKQVSPGKQTPTSGEMYDYVDFRARVGASLVGVPWTTHAGSNGQNIGLPATEGLYNILYAMAYANGQSNVDLPIKLTGLTAGTTYELRFWERTWEMGTVGKRRVRFTFTPDGGVAESHDVDIDGVGLDGPYYIAFRFTATSGSYQVTSRSLASDTWHLYGATVEEVSVTDYGRRFLKFADDTVFDGPVTGCGYVEKDGAGVLKLMGADVAPTGFWHIHEGGVLLGSAAATFGEAAVSARGTFGGRGRVAGRVGVAAGGTLVLGDAEAGGTLTVAGRLALGEGVNVVVNGTGGCVAEGEVVLPKALNVKPSARLKRRTALFASATALTDLDVSGWTVFREDGATVDVAAQIKLADDGKTVWALPNSGTTVFIR